jgi:hypothetical protein
MMMVLLLWLAIIVDVRVIAATNRDLKELAGNDPNPRPAKKEEAGEDGQLGEMTQRKVTG